MLMIQKYLVYYITYQIRSSNFSSERYQTHPGNFSYYLELYTSLYSNQKTASEQGEKVKLLL